jgi:hypothetical protein
MGEDAAAEAEDDMLEGDRWDRIRRVWALTWQTAVSGVILSLVYGLERFFGLAGTRGGWLWATLLTTAVAVWLARTLPTDLVDRRRLLAAGAVLGVAAGTLLWLVTPAMWDRVRAVIDRVEVPAEAELTEDRRAGNPICFDVCPSVHRSYRAVGEVEQVRREFADAFADAGFDLRPYDGGYRKGFVATRRLARVAVQVTFVRPGNQAGPGPPRPVEIEMDAEGG